MKQGKLILWVGVAVVVLMMAKACSNVQELGIIENGTDVERREVYEVLGYE